MALKLIKRGMDTEEVVARFESERQALSLMEHPAIARVFDGGASDEGRPFFVMEYVEGVPVTAYCDDRRLSTAERLELFLEICAGVQHAHHKGIIHRDLKPSNILVAEPDGKPLPKIIDFGIAKATGAELEGHAVETRLGQWVGTPEYMSPEQAALGAIDIDTRTDVYSLGVILYELLSGVHPLREHLREAGFDEARGHILETEPPRPSTRVSSLGDTSTEVAERRATDPAALVRRLSGDLDWIVLKAIEKDRARRYGSPAELADDIARHLRNEPVQARSPSTAYRVQKFVRRHRVGVAAAALVLIALVAGTAVSLWQAVRATAAERVAREQAETARSISEFLVGLFELSDPYEAAGRNLTAGEILDRGAERIGRDLEDEPVVQARLLSTIGQVYTQLGLFEEAEGHLDRALELQRELLEAEDPETFGTQVRRGWLAFATGEYERAERIYENILPSLRDLEGDAAELPSEPEWAEAVNDYGVLQWALGNHERAQILLERALAMNEEVYGPEHAEVATTLANLALARQDAGDLEAARPLYERALAIQEKTRGPSHPSLTTTLVNLASLERRMGEFETARRQLERGLAIAEDAFGPDHPSTASMSNGLGIVLFQLADYEAAESHLERAGKIWRETLGADHPATAANTQHRARVLEARGDLVGASGLYEESARAYEASVGRDHPDLAGTLAEWAEVLEQTGELDEALVLYERAAEIVRERLPPEHAGAVALLERYGEFLRRIGPRTD